ncbi:fibronectin type III domain-containing protein [Aquimarina latercula]|uniref:fibronectin type III domain-containing protein n=1 Tax=Aquimarina latercula TaxID=987 RepID=UPI000414090C|nr:fibronectin type III domain-containing protein [Aquimarina latercula]
MKKTLLLLIASYLISCSNDDSTTTNQAPANFTVTTEIINNDVTISWTEATDPEGEQVTYEVILDSESISIDQESTSYQINDLSYDTTYEGSIIARDVDGLTTTSDFSFSIGEKNNTPPTVELLGIDNGEVIQQFTDITLTWKGMDQENDPLIYTVRIGPSPGSLQQMAFNYTEENYTIDYLTTGETYYWQISVFDGLVRTDSEIKGFKVYEKVFEGDYEINNPQEMETFANEGYTQITGDFSLIDYANTNSDGLQSLNKIGGNLIIRRTNLPDLKGFKNLEIMEGHLLISKNNFISNLEGLERIKKIDKGLFILRNELLSDLQGIENIGLTIDGYVSIIENSSLSNMSILEKIRTINGYLWIQGNQITNIEFPNLEEVNGEVFNNVYHQIGIKIVINGKLKKIQMPALTKASRIEIRSNILLTEVTMNSIATIENELLISSNGNLTTINDFRNLIGNSANFSLEINGNRKLENITLPSIHTIDKILIEQNEKLATIQLNNLENVTTSFSILNNEILEDYCSLASYAVKALEEQKEIITQGNLYNPTTAMIATREGCKL